MKMMIENIMFTGVQEIEMEEISVFKILLFHLRLNLVTGV